MNRIKLKPFAISVLIPLAVGALSAFITRDAMADFDKLYKPLLSPPGKLFPVVWTVLYILMGIASYLVYTSGASQPRKKRALRVYAAQLAVNFLWPIIFFSLKAYLPAFFVLLILMTLIAATMIVFGYIDPLSEKLLIPYLLWSAFAAYLNFGIFLLN